MAPAEDDIPEKNTFQDAHATCRSTSNFALNHPSLRRHDSESIRIFVRKYDIYCTEINEQAAQLGSVESSEALTDPLLRAYLEKKSAASKQNVTLLGLDKIVGKQLSMNMSKFSATLRMEGLFISYITLLAGMASLGFSKKAQRLLCTTNFLPSVQNPCRLVFLKIWSSPSVLYAKTFVLSWIMRFSSLKHFNWWTADALESPPQFPRGSERPDMELNLQLLVMHLRPTQ